MFRVIVIFLLCLLCATGIVTWFKNLPSLSSADKKMVKMGLIVLAIAAILFIGFIFLAQMDNNNAGVLR